MNDATKKTARTSGGLLQTEKEKEGVQATIGMNTSGNMTMRTKTKRKKRYEKHFCFNLGKRAYIIWVFKFR